MYPQVYAAKHKDEIVRSLSRSGGVFTAISDEILESSGVVYGCILTESFDAVHYRATNKFERDKMRGSKYIQSKLGNTYNLVKKDLDAGKQVLFSGTSCQVAGLKKFLLRPYNNLFCVDIVCHGVPSPAVWHKYLAYQEMKNKNKIKNVDFRNKVDYGWKAHIESLKMCDGSRVDSHIFRDLFYEHYILRPSCYKCLYKSIMHPGDITIADYWGIQKAAPEFDDDKGVSLVLVNNDAAALFFEQIKKRIIWKNTKIEDSLQPPLIAPFQEPYNRKKFWKDYLKNDFEYIVNKYCKKNRLDILLEKIYRGKKKIIHYLKCIINNVQGS